MDNPKHTVDLIARVEAAAGADNALDVEIEITLFKPSGRYVAIRANNAGNKVIYTLADGGEDTHWAEDWTMGYRKKHTIAALKAHKEMRDGQG